MLRSTLDGGLTILDVDLRRPAVEFDFVNPKRTGFSLASTPWGGGLGFYAAHRENGFSDTNAMVKPEALNNEFVCQQSNQF